MSDQKAPPAGAATAADWDALKKSQPSDYDGHTGFERMSPDARLRWLDQAVEFVARHKGEAAKRVMSAGCVIAEENPLTEGIRGHRVPPTRGGCQPA